MDSRSNSHSPQTCMVCGKILTKRQIRYCSMPCAGADWAVSGEQWPRKAQLLWAKRFPQIRSPWWDSEIIKQWDSQVTARTLAEMNKELREARVTPRYGYTRFTKELKLYIRERDGYTCAICGKYGRCVHHIDYNKENPSRENLITLCTRCHNRTNGNRKHWGSLLSPIAIEREKAQIQSVA